MKKIILFLASVLMIGSSFSLNLKGCYKKYIKFSAYYSPIYGQKFYYKWNFYLEKRLNWRWIRWASWRRVFNWMLAGPKNYKFGTKIYIPGLWVWQVEDRWGAIVNAGKRWEKYDRIDIWVGKWDKALTRALSFGKQVRLARVCPPSKRIKVGFNYSKFPILKWFFKKTLWSIGLSYGRKDRWVRTLQEYLVKLGYMKHKPTGYFGRLTKIALTKFQNANWIKTRYYGYFGPKTRVKLKQIILKKWTYNKVPVIKKEKKKVEKNNIKKRKINNELALLKRWLGKWYNTYEVKILQKYLKKMWYYNWKIDGFYGVDTVQAVAKFQVKNGIIKKTNWYLAWYFGPKTRTKFKKLVKERFMKL